MKNSIDIELSQDEVQLDFDKWNSPIWAPNDKGWAKINKEGKDAIIFCLEENGEGKNYIDVLWNGPKIKGINDGSYACGYFTTVYMSEQEIEESIDKERWEGVAAYKLRTEDMLYVELTPPLPF